MSGVQTLREFAWRDVVNLNWTDYRVNRTDYVVDWTEYVTNPTD